MNCYVNSDYSYEATTEAAIHSSQGGTTYSYPYPATEAIEAIDAIDAIEAIEAIGQCVFLHIEVIMLSPIPRLHRAQPVCVLMPRIIERRALIWSHTFAHYKTEVHIAKTARR